VIHHKHKLKIKELTKRVEGELEREFEKLAAEICRDTVMSTLNATTEYTTWLRREVVMKVLDAKVAIREGRAEEALKTLDELLTILDL